jgi:hypothetical protein
VFVPCKWSSLPRPSISYKENELLGPYSQFVFFATYKLAE